MSLKDDFLRKINNGIVRGAQAVLAEKLQVTQSASGRWIRGIQYPAEQYIIAMAKLVDWPEDKIRKMFDDIQKEKPTEEFSQSVKAMPLTPSNSIQLPILADVPAGLPEYSDRDVEMFVDIPRFLFPGADFVVKCIGDSLEPKIHKGDYCVIRKTEDVIEGRPMLVKTEDGACMKIVKKLKSGMKLCSLNPKYDPFITNEVQIIGLIIGHWSRDDRESWA